MRRGATVEVILGYVGANVSRLRVRQGLTQESLAEAAGLDVRYLVRIQRGAVGPSMEVLVALANALEVSPDRLLRPAKVAAPRPGRPPGQRTR